MFALGGYQGCATGACGAAAPAPMPLVAAAAPCQENRAYQYNMPAAYNCNADSATRCSQQLYDNNNHIYVTQPVINDRNHHVNHLNRTLIRDNNYHHYRVNNLYRDNVINRYYNQVFRVQRNFADYSSSQGVIQGTCTSTPPVNTYHVLPGCNQAAPIAAAPAPLALAGPAPCGGAAWF